MAMKFWAAAALLTAAHAGHAALLTDPNDARTWQGASVGTFAQLYYGSNTLATRTQVINAQLLDDGVFNSAGYTGATMISGGGGVGTSFDLSGTDSFAYGGCACTPSQAGSTIDNTWVQTSGTVGVNVWDLGFQASKAAVFNTIDHGPLPEEAIESTVYLSNDKITWTAAKVERVWLEGFQPNTGIKWDGFTYAVGTGTAATFRYASVIHGGPGALISDGDNEINGIMGLQSNFTPTPAIPEPSTYALMAIGLLGVGAVARRRRPSR